MSQRLLTGLLLAVLAVLLAMAPAHPGSTLVYVAQVGCWAVFAWLAIWPRPSIAYSALAAMWTLAFPLKLALHLVVAYPYQEPVGNFTGAPAQWDAALLVVGAGMLGAAAARLLTLRLPADLPAGGPPAWYCRAPRLIWLTAAAAMLAVAVVNVWGAFYRIGMHPALTLPARGHILIAWLIALGGGLGVAALVDWELSRHRAGRRVPATALMLAVCVEAVLTSTSALSRGIVLFRLVPYWLLAVHQRPGRLIAGRRRATVFAGCCIAALALTLALVTIDRAVRFTRAAREAQIAAAAAAPPPPPTASGVPAPSPAPPPVPVFGRVITVQLRNLVIDRWIGLEGVLAVTSASTRPSWREVVREPVSAGVDGWFQRMARPPYLRMEGFTFLTLPGPMAVLAVTASPLLVFTGILLSVTALLVLEWAIRRGAAGPHLPAMASVALANYFVQLNVPYAMFVFLVELLVTVSVLRFLEGRPTARPDLEAG